MTQRSHGSRRLIFVLAWGVSLSSAARAENVLFLSSEPRSLELFDALELALRGYGPLVTLGHAPEGASEEAHLASARRRGAGTGSSVAVWVEYAPPERVRAFALAQPERLFDAPLPEPLAGIEPRVFGSIAASVVLQALRSQPAPGAALPSASAASAGPSAAERTAGEVPPAPRPPRFFLRPAFTLGMAFVGEGHTPDRLPSVDLVTAAQTYQEEGGAGSYLYESGYDCQVSADVPLVASNCNVAVKNPGVVYAPVFELSAGLRVWRELAVALTLRYSPHAGEGALSSVLFGAEASWALLSAPRRGWYAELAAGWGIGQIQVRPPADSARKGPFVSSGFYNLRGGALVGYRLSPGLGLFAGLTLHAMLPDQLWVLDPKAGLELRL